MMVIPCLRACTDAAFSENCRCFGIWGTILCLMALLRLRALIGIPARPGGDDITRRNQAVAFRLRLILPIGERDETG